MPAAGNENTNTNPNFIFTMKETKLYVPSSLSKLLSKGFEMSVFWNEYKAKSKNNNTANEYRYFFGLNLVESIDCLF